MVWGLTFALSIVLWARSYSFVDQYYHHIRAKWMFVQSREGTVMFGLLPVAEVPHDLEWWGGQTIEIWGTMAPTSYQLPFFEKWFRPFHEAPFYKDPDDSFLLPYWFLVTLFALFATAPHAPWKWRIRKMRFSLRMLLITMTMIALVLALALYAAKHDF
jgi:hypothetical protein